MKVKTTEPRDITGQIGELLRSPDEPEYPMYSYSRPAWLFWQGFYEAAIEAGYTHDQSIEILQSKHPRWLLDGAGEKLTELGREMFGDKNQYSGLFLAPKKKEKRK